MITTKQAENAKFWNQWICLDCGEVVDPSPVPPDECANCEGGNVFQGALIVLILDNVED